VSTTVGPSTLLIDVEDKSGTSGKNRSTQCIDRKSAQFEQKNNNGG